METNVASDFQMMEFHTRELLLRIPIDFDADALSFGYRAHLEHGVDRETQKRIGKVQLNFKLIDGEDFTLDDETNQTFSATIACQGKFEMSAEAGDQDRFLEMLKTAGAATMIPIARSHIMTACSLVGASGNVRIPNINVYAINTWIEESLSPDSISTADAP